MSFLSDYYQQATSEELKPLEKLWSYVHSIEPEAVEGLSYDLPAFKLNDRPLIGFSLHSEFMSVYPYSPKIISALHKELEEYETSKGAVRFTVNNPISEAVIDLIIDLRKTELSNNSYKKSKGGIAIDARDPIQDVMSDKEIGAAYESILNLLGENQD